MQEVGPAPCRTALAVVDRAGFTVTPPLLLGSGQEDLIQLCTKTKTKRLEVLTDVTVSDCSASGQKKQNKNQLSTSIHNTKKIRTVKINS